jgi:hypothetical protein
MTPTVARGSDSIKSHSREGQRLRLNLLPRSRAIATAIQLTPKVQSHRIEIVIRPGDANNKSMEECSMYPFPPATCIRRENNSKAKSDFQTTNIIPRGNPTKDLVLRNFILGSPPSPVIAARPTEKPVRERLVSAPLCLANPLWRKWPPAPRAYRPISGSIVCTPRCCASSRCCLERGGLHIFSPGNISDTVVPHPSDLTYRERPRRRRPPP